MAKDRGVLVDTDILVDLSKNKEAALNFFDNLSQERMPIYISSISAMELLVGARNKKEVDEIDTFISTYQQCHLNQSISDQAYQLLKLYTKSHGLEIPDALVAASALTNGFSLATTNRKHFSMIKGLELIPSY